MKPFSLSSSKSNCIQLHRFVRLGNKADSQVFTFIVPFQLTRGFINAAQSKEFCYGDQTWQLNLCYKRDDTTAVVNGLASDQASHNILTNPLNVGLTLCGGLAGMLCELEAIRFTILNRESIHANKTHEIKNSSFTAEEPIKWKENWFKVDSLAPDNFLFDDWTWLLELELQGARTTYQEFLSVPKTLKEASQCIYLETASFTFAGSDWSISLEWMPGDLKKNTSGGLLPNRGEAISCPKIKLQRHSRTNHWCRVRYRTHLTWGSLGRSSFGPVDQLITSDSGASTLGNEIGDPKWFVNTNMQALLSPKTRIQITVEMLAAASVSRIDLVPIAPQGGKNFARCIDPDGQDWVVLSDILGTLVRLKFFPIVTVHNHLEGCSDGSRQDQSCEARCMAWFVHLIPHDTSKGVVKAMNSPYVSYIPSFRCHVQGADRIQMDSLQNKISQQIIHPDEVTEVALDLPVENVCDKNAGYIRPSDNTMTIRIEWLQSQRLFQSNYNVYDDLFQTHNKQLARELKALQLENHALEKQLYINSTPESAGLDVPVTSTNHFSQSMKQLNHASSIEKSHHHRNNSCYFIKSVSSDSPTGGKREEAANRPFKRFTGMELRLNNRISSMNLHPTSSVVSDDSTWEGGRRHSSTVVDTNGRPRRSLPQSPASESWRKLKRWEHDSDGYNSREESPLFLQVSDALRSNLSSPRRSRSPNNSTYTSQLPPLSNQSLTPMLTFSLSSEGRNLEPKLT